MMITRAACAGTLESSDVYVEVEPAEEGLSVHIESIVEKQFGEAIRSAVLEVLDEFNVENACVRIADRGALDCVIRARVEAAVCRGSEVLL